MKPGPQKRTQFKMQGHDPRKPAHSQFPNAGSTTSYSPNRKESAFGTDFTPPLTPATGRSWFLTVESAPKVVDIREQCPMLLRRETALALEIRHPVYTHSRLMTADVLITRVRNGQRTLVRAELKDDNRTLTHSSRTGASA